MIKKIKKLDTVLEVDDADDDDDESNEIEPEPEPEPKVESSGKVKCECGVDVLVKNMKRHKTSKSHKSFLEK